MKVGGSHAKPNPSQPQNPDPITSPPLVPDDPEQAAFALNSELAKAINQAISFIDQSDPNQLDWYLNAHGELFAILDVIYLLMQDAHPDEVGAIVSATRRHFHRCMDRWRTRQLELMEQALAFWDAAELAAANHRAPQWEPAPEPPPKPKLVKRVPEKWADKWMQGGKK